MQACGHSSFMGSHQKALSKEVKRFVSYNFCLATVLSLPGKGRALFGLTPL